MKLATVLLLVIASSSQAVQIYLNADINYWSAGFSLNTLTPSQEALPLAGVTVIQLYPGISATFEFSYHPSDPNDPSSPLTYRFAGVGPESWALPARFDWGFTDGVNSGAGGNTFAKRSDWEDQPGGDGWLYSGWESVRLYDTGYIAGTFSYRREIDPNFAHIPDTAPTALLLFLGLIGLVGLRHRCSSRRTIMKITPIFTALLLSAASSQAIAIIDRTLTDADTMVVDLMWASGWYREIGMAVGDTIPEGSGAFAVAWGNWQIGTIAVWHRNIGNGSFDIKFNGPMEEHPNPYDFGFVRDWVDQSYDNSTVTFDGSLLIPTGDYSVRAIWGVVPDVYASAIPDAGSTWLLASLGILSLFAVRRYASDGLA